MNQVKIERVNSLLEKEISTILMMEIKDPDIRFVTVTKVNTTNDLSFSEIVFLTNNQFLNDLITAKRDLCITFDFTYRFLKFTNRILKYTRFKGHKRNLKFLKELQKTLSEKHDDRVNTLDQYNYFLTCNF